ncbi:porin [Massilia sp. ST3]|uniref:porin n=1 Tax=Massilia sp. ST3 TaxID=2824903 RepID=UPI001B82B958|nr:porin [Massilia sp. ST3]MBQ5948408.1 porin [Massilia sp. ST3]
MYQHIVPGKLLPAALGTAMLACGLCATAQAADSSLTWKLSGFGTVGAVHSSNRDADFTTSPLKANGAGYTQSWSPDVDSRLGAQLDVSKGPWSGVVQVVSEQRLDGSYRPLVEWANVKYQVTPDLAVRAGRIALPIFLAADYRKVGYIVPWVRTPTELYGGQPLSGSDGVDLTWRWTGGALRNTTQAFYGHTDLNLYNGLRLKAAGIAGLSHSIEQGAFSGRVSAGTATLTTDLGGELFGALRAFRPQGQSLADRYDIVDKRVVIMTAGATYDPGEWFVTAEGGRTRTASVLGAYTAVYVGAGMRFGAFTPYAGYARSHADVPTTDPGLPLAGLPPRLAATAGMLNAGLNAYLFAMAAQSTWSTGLRWDFAPNMALKAQYERALPKQGTRGTFSNDQPGYRPDRPIHVTSVALDFVF